MKEYIDMVKHVLVNGTLKHNRTGIYTISDFSYYYKVNISNKFPLLTTKKVNSEAMIRETLWYLIGENHVRDFGKHSKIWNDWADSNGNLETAYGRFWRRFPIHEQRLEGEALAGEFGKKDISKYIHIESDANGEHKTLDQIALVRDLILHDPDSRRMVVTAWDPPNALASKLPPCHYTFVFNVKDDKLNCHLTQRSGDIALGIPFNLPAYTLLTYIMAMQTELPELRAVRKLSPGIFSHTIVDAHVYCGDESRAQFYKNHLKEFQMHLRNAKTSDQIADIMSWIEETAPADPNKYDHTPGLLLQATRPIQRQPKLYIAHKQLDELTVDDIKIAGYKHDEPIKFKVAA